MNKLKVYFYNKNDIEEIERMIEQNKKLITKFKDSKMTDI